MSAVPISPNRIGNQKFPFLSNVETGITALAGGGQTGAYQLTAQISRVDTVASGNDSVALPKITASPGQLGSVGTILMVANNAASNSMQVYGATPDTINGVATGTGVAVAAGVNVWFTAVNYTASTGVGTWVMTNSQAAAVAAITSGTIDGAAIGGSTPAAGAFTTLFASGLFKLSGIETGLTAHAGGGQASALALSTTKPIHNVTTVGSGNDSCALPASTGGGAIHWIKNSNAANSLQLYGSGTDTIDGVVTGTGVAVAAGKSRICLDFAAGTWLSIYGA